MYLPIYSARIAELVMPLKGHFTLRAKLQALVYHILPSTTAVFSYTIGSRKLSANEHFFFFLGAQTVVSLLQTTQIKQGVSFIAANKVYTSTNKTTIVWIETELSFLPGVDASHVYVRALALGCFYSHISTRTFRRALTASLDICAEIECPFSGVTKSGRVWRKVTESNARSVTQSITFRHLPPDSARNGYATEGALFMSAQLTTDAVSVLRKCWVLITLRASLSGTHLFEGRMS